MRHYLPLTLRIALRGCVGPASRPSLRAKPSLRACRACGSLRAVAYNRRLHNTDQRASNEPAKPVIMDVLCAWFTGTLLLLFLRHCGYV